MIRINNIRPEHVKSVTLNRMWLCPDWLQAEVRLSLKKKKVSFRFQCGLSQLLLCKIGILVVFPVLPFSAQCVRGVVSVTVSF